MVCKNRSKGGVVRMYGTEFWYGRLGTELILKSGLNSFSLQVRINQSLSLSLGFAAWSWVTGDFRNSSFLHFS